MCSGVSFGGEKVERTLMDYKSKPAETLSTCKTEAFTRFGNDKEIVALRFNPVSNTFVINGGKLMEKQNVITPKSNRDGVRIEARNLGVINKFGGKFYALKSLGIG